METENNHGNMENKPARDEKGRLLPGHTANPSGRPKGRNWITTLAELAETKTRGGGGKARAVKILENLLERAESDNAATNIVLERLAGKVTQHVDHTSGGEPLNASISFVDAIDVTPRPDELGEPKESM